MGAGLTAEQMLPFPAARNQDGVGLVTQAAGKGHPSLGLGGLVFQVTKATPPSLRGGHWG